MHSHTSFPFPNTDLLSNVSNSEDEEEDQHDLDIEIKHKEDIDPIQHLFQLRSLNGPKISLKQLGMLLGIQMTKEE